MTCHAELVSVSQHTLEILPKGLFWRVNPDSHLDRITFEGGRTISLANNLAPHLAFT